MSVDLWFWRGVVHGCLLTIGAASLGLKVIETILLHKRNFRGNNIKVVIWLVAKFGCFYKFLSVLACNPKALVFESAERQGDGYFFRCGERSIIRGRRISRSSEGSGDRRKDDSESKG